MKSLEQIAVIVIGVVAIVAIILATIMPCEKSNVAAAGDGRTPAAGKGIEQQVGEQTEQMDGGVDHLKDSKSQALADALKAHNTIMKAAGVAYSNSLRRIEAQYATNSTK